MSKDDHPSLSSDSKSAILVIKSLLRAGPQEPQEQEGNLSPGFTVQSREAWEGRMLLTS